MDRRGAITVLLAAIGSLPASLTAPASEAAPMKKGKGYGVAFRETFPMEYPVEIRLTDSWMHVTMTDGCKGFRFTLHGQTCEVTADEVFAALSTQSSTPTGNSGGLIWATPKKETGHE